MYLKIHNDKDAGFINYTTGEIFIDIKSKFVDIILCHELAHHILKHGRGNNGYYWSTINNVFKREQAAWKYVINNFKKYNKLTDEHKEFIKDCLITYCEHYNKPNKIALDFCKKYIEEEFI